MINETMAILGKERSAIRELFEQGKVLKEKYGKDRVYDFSLGNPNIKAPESVKNSIIKLVSNDDKSSLVNLHGYTSAEGDKNVRTCISKYLDSTYNAKTDPNLIYMTAGAAAALSILLKALTSSNNDKVILFAPYFPEYTVFIKNAGAKCITIKPNLSTFYPDINDFKNKITKNTSVVIVNSPNNPTGVLYKKHIIEAICNVLQEKEKEYNHPIYLISDEPYRELIYSDDAYPFMTNHYDDSIITYSFSKSVSLPGERIGYILVNPLCADSKNIFNAICGAGRSLGYVCAPSLFQFIIPDILGSTSDISIYKNNANLLYNNLKSIGYDVIKPDGAFYLFVKALEDDDIRFSKKALEQNLLIVPSTSFGIKGYVRIAYCVDESQIKNAIPKFQELYNNYKY